MSDSAPFLRAICAHPDDDGPRLVYADWLDERGDPRGEFIRVQCGLAKLSGPCGGYYCDENIGHVDCPDPTGEKLAELSHRSRWLEERPKFGDHGAACWTIWAEPILKLLPY